ncbi:MAG: PhoH family protein [Planctomycetota bacterium]
MELTIQLPPGDAGMGVTGPSERNLKIVREALGVTLAARNGALRVSGDPRPVGQAAHVLELLTEAAEHRRPMSRQQLLDAIALAATMDAERPAASAPPRSHSTPRASPNEDPRLPLGAGGLDVYLPGKRVRAMTEGQRAYLAAMLEHDLTFCMGPAGTGKTYLATAAATAMLKRGEVRKLVLVRPAVEAGEKLGFLPGSMQEKVNPYLRPLLDALHDMMEYEQLQRFMAVDLIEIVPLAFMRGRTLNDACIILDEAQNTTRAQMLMFLTRLGHGSKMVVTGDTSQIDLEDPRSSGLIDAVRRLRRTKGVGMVTLDGSDIVRHHLVQRIVEAYGGPQTNGPSAASLMLESANADPPAAGASPSGMDR